MGTDLILRASSVLLQIKNFSSEYKEVLFPLHKDFWSSCEECSEVMLEAFVFYLRYLDSCLQKGEAPLYSITSAIRHLLLQEDRGLMYVWNVFLQQLWKPQEGKQLAHIASWIQGGGQGFPEKIPQPM